MTVLYDPKVVLSAVREELGIDSSVPVVGSSTQGIARAGAGTETDRVVGVALLCSDKFKARSPLAEHLAADATAAGRKNAADLSDPAQLRDNPRIGLVTPRTSC